MAATPDDDGQHRQENQGGKKRHHVPVDVAELRQEDGTIETDRPETEEKFRAFFEASGRNAFYGVLLEDEEGKLGVLGFECDEPLVFDEGTRDLLQILVNQATVAVRNAQLYQKACDGGYAEACAARGSAPPGRAH